MFAVCSPPRLFDHASQELIVAGLLGCLLIDGAWHEHRVAVRADRGVIEAKDEIGERHGSAVGGVDDAALVTGRGVVRLGGERYLRPIRDGLRWPAFPNALSETC